MTSQNNDLIIHSGDEDGEDRIFREQETGNIESGTFWRCLGAVTGIDVKYERTSHSFREGEICLMTRMEYFDGKIHSVVLLSDPQYGKGSGLLTVTLFIQHFEWVPKAKAQERRTEQIAEIMGRTAELQQEMTDAMANPTKLDSIVDKKIKQWEIDEARRNAPDDDEEEGDTKTEHLPSVSKSHQGRFDLSAAVSNKIGASDVAVFAHMAKRQGKIAEIRAEWLQEKVGEMTRVMEKLPPFYSEHANLGLAGAHEALSTASEIQKGLRSLRLYTGEGVSVRTLIKGASASSDEPLTVFQRKLFMDEEFAVWTDVDRLFDYTREEDFWAAFEQNAELREQLLPAPRGVLSMATRRSEVRYSVKNLAESFEAMEKNRLNKALFLLVRDGENWYAVYSDEPSHEISERLFPTRNEMGEIFQGVDGETIGFEDLRFTNRTNEFAAKSLAYKRFLILVAGLDARLKLFGDFYPEHLAPNFISMGFQNKYMRFVSDDDSDYMLDTGRISVHELIRANHQGLAAGSRVMVFGKNALVQEAAPGAFDKGTRGKDYETHYCRLANSEKKFDILTVRLSKNDLVVDLPVERISQYRRHSYERLVNTNFNVRVALNKLDTFKDSLGFLVLETVTADMLRPYIYSRKSRASHVDYIYAFKLAVQVLEGREQSSAVTLAALTEIALNTYGLTDDQSKRSAFAALQAWRQKNIMADSAPLPAEPAFAELSEDLAEIAHAFRTGIPKVCAAIESLGGIPRRIMRGKRGSLIAYYTQPDSERDLRIHNWKWVGRRTFSPTGKMVDEAPQIVALSDRRIVGEVEMARMLDSSLVDTSISFMQQEKVDEERLQMVSRLDTVDLVTKCLVTAFKGHKQGISDEMWLLMTSGSEEVIEEICDGYVSSFPIGVETKYQRMLTLQVKFADLINWYGSDAQRAVLNGWAEALEDKRAQSHMGKKKKKKEKAVPLSQITVRGGSSWRPEEGGHIDHGSSSFRDAYNVSHYVNQQRTQANDALARFLVSVPSEVDRHSSEPFIDPASTWFGPDCYNAEGVLDVERFFPGYPPLEPVQTSEDTSDDDDTDESDE